MGWAIQGRLKWVLGWVSRVESEDTEHGMMAEVTGVSTLGMEL